ncbi:SMR family transporter [Helicobacter sp. 12S02634-8]|uniref:SMR family transporter n=1 Tax=Helicobacter sp. 12S02634-8 TaxID=1476199 RepID=UPI00209C2ACD|nr:SMR family transporter [Helicobacter sp. 12S02634-8]
MYLVFVILAALLDILANLVLKKSDGFKNKFLGILCMALVLCAFVCLGLALKEIPLSIAYSTWGAIGVIGTILGGYYFFGERLNLLGKLGAILVVVAVVLLHI